MTESDSALAPAARYRQAQQWLVAQPALRSALTARLAALPARLPAALRPTRPIRLEYTLRGCAAGRAGPEAIRLNPVLLQENQAAFLDEVLPHEFAHCAVLQRVPGASAHGAQWQRIMALLDVPARRCHGFDTRNARTRRLVRHPYRCGCGPLELTSIRHRRIQQGARYHCRRCGQALCPAA